MKPRPRPSPSHLLLPLLAVVLASTAPSASFAAPLSPFSAVHAATAGEYDTFEFKFTFLGTQKKAVSSLMLVGTGRAFTLGPFIPYERAGLDFGNDDFAVGDTLVFLGTELKAFVDSIATVAALQDTSLIPEPNASLMILRDFGGSEACWEHLATRLETEDLFLKLKGAVMDPGMKDRIDAYRRQMAGVMP